MANRVDFDMDAILQFWRELQEFSSQAGDIVQQMNSALNTVRETWQDHQLDKPSMDILEANERIMCTISELCPTLEAFLKKQEQFHDDYISC